MQLNEESTANQTKPNLILSNHRSFFYSCYNHQTCRRYFYVQLHLKLVGKFTYHGSSVSSTKSDINTWLAKVWTAPIGSRSYGSQTWPIKWNAVFFQAAVVSILLYVWTTSTLTKRMEKKLDGNYTRMLRVVLNKSWRQHPHKAAAVRPLITYHRNYPT